MIAISLAFVTRSQVVLIDERFELMLIFWSTIAIFQHNFGSTIKATLTDTISQIKKCV